MRGTINNLVYQKLRRHIMEGHLRPGERLVQDSICRKLGVSRMPLREALRQLEREGLVASHPFCGAAVRTISQKEFAELFDLREVLEGLAARTAARTATAQDLDELERLAKECDETAAQRQFSRSLQVNAQFHRRMVELSGNETLVHLMEIYRFQLRSYQVLNHHPYFEAYMQRETKDEHQRIVKALRTGDLSLAEETLRSVIRNGKAIALKVVEQVIAGGVG